MIFENILLAIQSLRSNKMRSLLTMLGIIIGISAVIAIVNVGDSMENTVNEQMQEMGAGNIYLSIKERGEESNTMMFFGGGGVAVSPRVGGQGTRLSGKTPQSSDLITNKMLTEMMERFSGKVEAYSLSQSGGAAKGQDNDLYANVTIMGVNEGYKIANNVTVDYGRFINDNDVDSFAKTAVVSDKFVNNLFPDKTMEEALGEQVKIYKQTKIEIYTIVGIYEYEQMSFGGMSVADKEVTTSLYIPISVEKQNIIEKNYTSVTLVTSKSQDVTELTNELQMYFDFLYLDNENWEINVSNMTSMIETMNTMLGQIITSIAVIAAISLLVGGIGIMNIMLVSVTERTREIGTRKALGAKTFHIQLQFLIESVIVSLVGGFIGIVLGSVLGGILSTALGGSVMISVPIIILSFGFSMFIGMFFGIYPASKAAKLDPIEALRYE